jgi:hypothetical protein
MINSLRYGVQFARLTRNIKGFSTVYAKDLSKTNKIAVDDAIKTANLSAPLLDVPTVRIIYIIILRRRRRFLKISIYFLSIDEYCETSILVEQGAERN